MDGRAPGGGPREGWRRIYAEAPEIFDAFARAEDPGGAIARALAEAAGLPDARTRVLELGSGTGRLAGRLAPACASFVAVEPVPVMLALARARLAGLARTAMVRARAESLPFPAASFDVVVAAWVVAYLRCAVRGRVLAEATRVLDPRGRGLLLVESAPDGEFQDLRRASGADPAREFGALEAAGFAVITRIDTEIVFDDETQARRVIGALCGNGASAALDAAPRRRIGHAAVILRQAR